jgi:hypothetical protein
MNQEGQDYENKAQNLEPFWRGKEVRSDRRSVNWALSDTKYQFRGCRGVPLLHRLTIQFIKEETDGTTDIF